jgi:DNA invertase Pin-like site-specific DNA recombinase
MWPVTEPSPDGAEVRLVGVIRLSRDSDTSTAPERQRQEIESGLRPGEVIIGWATDVGVSGSISPKKRPELGPWMSKHPPEPFDGFIATKIDRFSRRSIHFHEMIEWAEKNDKVLRAVKDQFDLTTWVGRLIAMIIAMFAEGELEAITERVKASRNTLRAAGRWMGGKAPFWCKAVRRREADGKTGVYLEHHEERSKITREMIDMIIKPRKDGGGMAKNAIANTLTARGVLSPKDWERVDKGLAKKGYAWSDQTVDLILRNEALRGYTTVLVDRSKRKFRVLRDTNGKPVMKCEPLIDDQTWFLLQKKLDEGTNHQAGERNPSPLKKVSYCGKCGLAYNHINPGTRKARWYRCGSYTKIGATCTSRAVDADLLESLVSESILDRVGNERRVETIVIPATDYGEELHIVEESLRRLKKESDLGLIDENEEEEYFQRLANLTADRDKLKEMGASSEEQVQYVDMGETFGEAWASMEWDERRAFLISHGVKIMVHNPESGNRKSPLIETKVDLGNLEDLVKAARAI